jgi:phosphatidylinositol glycan class A protein
MPHIVYTLRVILYAILILTDSALAIFIAIISAILGKRSNTNYYAGRTFCYVGGVIMGWKFVVEGEEYLWGHGAGEGEGSGHAGTGSGSSVMVGNHQR